MTARWDLFCRVIDNFGDAGIAWRLARELHDEHRLDVTIWIDAPDVLLPLTGTTLVDDPLLVHGVRVRALAQWRPTREFPAVIVDVLGGSIPRECVEAMHHATLPPRWFVVEYLSAEPWVEDRHGLPSPHPATGIARRFWFPGFTPRTAGLLRERDLFARRDAFRRDGERQRALWRALRVEEPREPATHVSLFCYPHAPMRSLLQAFTENRYPIACYVPETAANDALLHTDDGMPPRVGQPVQRGALVLHVVPFVPQERYDELLWACDINFVRGEDSFVRAQWAARPLVWHVYRQEHDTHVAKLDAFVNRYAAGLSDAARDAVRTFWDAWNGRMPASELAPAWQRMIALAGELDRHAVAWAQTLARLPELATTLVQAASSKV